MLTELCLFDKEIICFTFFICGGPCHRSSCSVLGLYIPLRAACLFSYRKNINISEFVLLPLYCEDENSEFEFFLIFSFFSPELSLIRYFIIIS